MATADGVGKIYIDKTEWHKFLIECAPFLKGEVVFGPITSNSDCIEVDYAFSDEVHPSTWILPPSWLKKETK